MKQSFFLVVALLLVASTWLADTAISANLPMQKGLLVMSDGNNAALEIDPTAVTPLSAGLQLNRVPSNRQWQLLPVTGQPGRVLIHQTFDNVLLASDQTANSDDPARLKVLAFTADPPTSAQWRLIETAANSRAYLIMNVESGRLLDADNSAAPTAPISKVQLLGGNATTPTATNQWRLFPPSANPQFVNSAANQPLLISSPVVLTGSTPNALTVPDAGTNVNVTFKIIGEGTSQLTAQITVNATSGGQPVTGTISQTILTKPGKKILLPPTLPRNAGQLEQKLTFTVPAPFPVYAVIPISAGAAQGVVNPQNWPAPLTDNIIVAAIWSNNGPGGPTKNGFNLLMESIPFFDDLD